MALHDLYVNDKDRQELADAALCRDRFLSWGWLGTRAHCPLLANLGLLRPPLPRFGWSVVALHDLLLYIIRTHQELDDAGTQGACGLSPWLPGMGITAGFGCGDEFLGVWMGPLKFTLGCQGVLFLHLLTDRAAGAVVDKMTTWELTRPLPTSGQKAGFCFSVPLAMSPTGQLALRTRRQHTAQHLDIQSQAL